jgi:pimeloyl-ACP methyl ester carboxylesterase
MKRSGAGPSAALEPAAAPPDGGEADRALLRSLLGELPDLQASISCTTVSVEERPSYRLERLVLELNDTEAVPAYFAKPLTGNARRPTVIYSHAHGDDYCLGKDELIAGRKELQPTPYVEALTGLGYGVLAIDHWNFGERRGRTESELFKEMLWKGRVLFGLMVHDNLRAIDYLLSRVDVDAHRIAALGMSMGSTLSWWTAALDPRVHTVVDLCCMSDFHALLERRALDRHGIYYYVPGAAAALHDRENPGFDLPEAPLEPRGQLRPADAERGARSYRPADEAALRGSRRSGSVEARALRLRPHRDRSDAGRSPVLPAQAPGARAPRRF